MADLTARYHVGKPMVRAWLREAGIPIRTHREAAGRRRWLTPPSPADLRALYENEGLGAEPLAERLGVSSTTITRWLIDAGIPLRKGRLKNRRRGQRDVLQPADARTLTRLYVEEERSVNDIARELGATVHLVRMWMDEAGVTRRRGGNRAGRPHPVRVRHQPPPADELRRLRLQEAVSGVALAARYGVHVETLRGWLRDAEVPTGQVQRPLCGDEVVRLYESGASMRVVADQLGTSEQRVSHALHDAGVTIDRAARCRRASAARAERHRAEVALNSRDGRWAERRFVDDEWPMSRIAASLGLPVAAVRRHLEAQGVPVVRHAYPGRRDRRTAPVTEVQRLYVEQTRPAVEVGAALGVTGWTVLRTGHAHGIPIRSGHPVIPAAVRVIGALYDDPEVKAVLDKHGVDHRPPPGNLAARFPVRVALTHELVHDLYEGAGCSTTHVELLTGQPAGVVKKRMRAWGLPLRDGLSPALRRFRAETRRELLAAAVRSTASAGPLDA